jgi:hypothetical protein
MFAKKPLGYRIRNLSLLLAQLTVPLLVSTLTPSALALPLAFERSYRNNAWVYQNYGCFVDEQQFTYTFDESKAEPFKLIGRVSTHEYQRGLSLLRELSSVSLIQGSGAADAGIMTWTGYFEGEPIVLKKAGDISLKRDSPQLVPMMELINSWCPKSLLPPLPE